MLIIYTFELFIFIDDPIIHDGSRWYKIIPSLAVTPLMDFDQRSIHQAFFSISKISISSITRCIALYAYNNTDAGNVNLALL